jgi:peptide/nickel transport system substrate-binding protein
MRTNSRHRGAQRLLASAVVVALALAACGGDDDGADDPPAGSDAPDPTSAPTPDTEGDGGDTDGGDTDDGDGTDDGDTPTTGGPVVITLPPETAPPEPTAVEGGTLRYALEAEVDGLNPTSSQLTAASGLVMAAAVFDTITALTPTGEAVPFLAESLTPNEDYTSWDVKLRAGITFHDGTPLNADAVRINFEAQYGDPLVGLAVVPFYPESGAVEVIDDLTVRFNLLEPNVQWPAYMASQVGMMASPAWIEAALADPTLNQQPVGTGPFQFESRSEDSVTRFVRNETWWKGRAFLDAVEFLPVPDNATRGDLLINGDIDALHTDDPGTIAVLDDSDGVNVLKNDSGEENFVMVNTEKPPFDDIRVRQALSLATPRNDYNALINLGFTRLADQMFIPESPFYNPNVVQEGDDPEAAAALIAEYCAERGSETNPVLNQPTCTDGRVNMEHQFSGPGVIQTREADLLTGAWSQLFNPTRQELLQDQHILEVVTSGYNVVTWRQLGALNPVVDNVWLLCRTIGGISLNFPRYCDEARDAALLRAQAATDEAERVAAYQEAVQLIHDSYAYIFLNHTLWAQVFADSVRGVCDRTAPDGTPLVCANGGTTWHDTIWIEQ